MVWSCLCLWDREMREKLHHLSPLTCNAVSTSSCPMSTVSGSTRHSTHSSYWSNPSAPQRQRAQLHGLYFTVASASNYLRGCVVFIYYFSCVFTVWSWCDVIFVKGKIFVFLSSSFFSPDTVVWRPLLFGSSPKIMVRPYQPWLGQFSLALIPI